MRRRRSIRIVNKPVEDNVNPLYGTLQLVAEHLEGWEADYDRLKRGEKVISCRLMAGGILRFEAELDRQWRYQIDGELRQNFKSRVTVNSTRHPMAIAREIEHRLLPGAAVLWAAVDKLKAKSDVDNAKCAAQEAEIETILGPRNADITAYPTSNGGFHLAAEIRGMDNLKNVLRYIKSLPDEPVVYEPVKEPDLDPEIAELKATIELSKACTGAIPKPLAKRLGELYMRRDDEAQKMPKGEGRWTKALYTSKCGLCDTAVEEGERGLYFREARTMLCEDCGQRAIRRAA